MSDADRASKIARLQKIDQLEAMDKTDSSGNGEGAPGIAAMGTDNVPTPAEQPLSRKLANMGYGAAQGLTAGYVPQIAGAVGGTFGEGSYMDNRDAMLKRLKEASNENPVLYKSAQLAGGVGGALLLPGAAEADAARLYKVLSAARGGAVLGAVQNPGDKPGVIDPVQAAPRTMAVGIGALTGGLVTGAATSPSLVKLANSKAFKALGPYARDVKRAMAKDQVQDIGRTALDEGVVGGVPTSFAGIAARATAAKAARGEEVGALLGKLGENEAAPTISRSDIADQLRSELIEPHADVASIAQKNKTLSDAIDHFEEGGDQHIPLIEAEMKKRALDQNINWRRLPQDDIPVSEQGDIALRGKLSKAVEDKAQEIDPKTATKFGEAKNAYGNLEKAETLSKGKTAHEMAKQLLAPGIGGTVGFAHGTDLEDRLKNMAYGIAGGLALRGGQLYGPQIIAPLANNAAKLNPWLAPTLATQGGQ
jgi:hypothetical protein